MKVFIDPGHGGDDPGAVGLLGPSRIEEDDINLAVGMKLGDLLVARGHEARITRAWDAGVHLWERTRWANDWPADIFISIHCDGATSSQAKGHSVWVHIECSSRTLTLAECIDRALDEAFPGNVDRNIHRGNFQVLRETMMPAVLIELDFITNPQMCRFLAEPANQAAFAAAIASGIEQYCEQLKEGGKNGSPDR